MKHVTQSKPLEAILTGETSESISLGEEFEENIVQEAFENLSDTSRSLINSFMAFYLIGDNTPNESEEIKIDFPIDSSCFEWLRGLYDFHQIKFPNIFCEIHNFPKVEPVDLSGKPLLAFSGGKDSAYVAMTEEVIPVHVTSMNPRFKNRELKAVDLVANHLGINCIKIPVDNSLNVEGNKGYQVRDGLIYTLLSTLGLFTGAKRILSGSYQEESWYCESKEGISGLNKILEAKGYPSRVEVLRDINEEEVIKYLLKNAPSLLNMTSSCVISEPDYSFLRSKYLNEFGNLPLLGDSCGLCGKCAQLNLARLIYDPSLRNASTEKGKRLVEYYHERFKSSPPFRDLVEKELLDKAMDKYK